MRVLVNGEAKELPEGASVADVLRSIAAPDTGIAVARGGEVMPRADWPRTPVEDGDTIEVLTAVQGG